MSRRLPGRRKRPRLDLWGILLAPLGIGVVVASQLADNVVIRTLMHGPAALIVLGGTLGAILVSFSPKEILGAFRAVRGTFMAVEDDSTNLATSIVALGMRSHRGGVLGLEDEVEAIADPFLRNGMTLVIEGVAAQTLREMLASERASQMAEDERPARIFEAAAGYAPTMGILGAVLGLVQVMQHLTAPGALGPGIAVAFVSTVYGVGMANLVLLPLAGRLRERAERAERRRELMSEGIRAIHERANPRVLAQKLRVFALALPRLEEIVARNTPIAARIRA